MFSKGRVAVFNPRNDAKRADNRLDRSAIFSRKATAVQDIDDFSSTVRMLVMEKLSIES